VAALASGWLLFQKPSIVPATGSSSVSIVRTLRGSAGLTAICDETVTKDVASHAIAINKAGGIATVWEYLVVRIKTAKLNEAEQILNDWGQEGWELVSVSWHAVWSIAYLKRLKE
jgi:hypothetical protein